MRKVRKRTDKTEEFDNKKIEKSIISAGAGVKIAQEISRGVKHTEGMKTADVRKYVTNKLTLHDEMFGKAYETYKKPAPAHK